MAKVTGVAMTTLSVDDSAGSLTDIRNDVTDWDIATPRGTQDVTGVDKSAIERLLLLADGTVNLNGGGFNASGAHTVFKTMSSTTVVRTVSFGFAGITLSMEMICTEYTITRGSDGGITWKATLVLANGTAPTWS